MSDSEEPEFFTPTEVAEKLRVAIATLAKWRLSKGKKQGPPWVPVGYNTIRYPRDDFYAWVEQQRRGREDA